MESANLESTLNLIKQAQGGASGALESLFTRYYPRVRQIVALRMGRRIASFVEHGDIAQEVLLRIFNGLERFEATTEGSFRNWISVSVERAIADQSRRSTARKRGKGEVKAFGAFGTELQLSSILAGSGSTPSQLAVKKELEEKVEAALLALPDHHRQIILLKYFCDMPTEEICTTLGIGDAATARKALCRAVDKLKELVGAGED